jgi:hypothetical protein
MFRNRHYINTILLGVIFLLASLQAASGADRSISVQAQVDRQEVTVGESFLLQIKVDGDDAPAEPDLSGLEDFAVQPKGGGQNNRESITIINGKINRVSEHGYVFRYEITPKRDGMLTIPAIEIIAGGKTLLTQPVPVRVAKPTVTDEFKLQVTLSETESYVGQPLVLTLKWYVNRDIAEFSFDLPFLEDQRFIFADHPEDSNYQGQDGIPINLPGGAVIARKGQERLDGLQYTTVTLRKILIPREPGEFALGRGAAFSKIITGYQGERPGQQFNFNRNFLDDVFGRRQAVYKQLVTESNDLTVKVLPLPEENRPFDFTGLVGKFSLAAEASPTEVNIGDPITLTIMVTGTEFMDKVEFPPLNNQAEIRENFKVPEEMGPGETDGRVKVFTQTIRAKQSSVKEIPGISLNYFNPETRKYESAATKAIPLQVSATKIVTAMDAEGNAAAVAKKELTSLQKGIAHNYVGEEILENQEIEIASWFSSPVGLTLVLFPPGAYLLVLLPLYIRRKRLQDTETLQAQKALAEFSRELAGLQKKKKQDELPQTVSGLVEAMRVYFSKRLRMPPGGVIYADLAERLQQYGVDSASLAELKKILDTCEAYHYGATAGEEKGGEKLQQMLTAVPALFKKIDRCIKK